MSIKLGVEDYCEKCQEFQPTVGSDMVVKCYYADRCEVLSKHIAANWDKERWIPVTERLPREHEPVLISYIYESKRKKSPMEVKGRDGLRCTSVVMAEIKYGQWHHSDVLSELVEGDSPIRVTHWMPLPSADGLE